MFLRPPTMPRRPAALLCLAALAAPALTTLPSTAWAQGFPGGGGMGMGPMGGGPGAGDRPAPREREAPPDVEDLLRPDPWRLWQRTLHEQQALPALARVRPALDALVREVDELQQLNERRVRLAVRRQRAVQSPKVDVARDLKAEAEDAQDWLEALRRTAQAWQSLASRADEPARQLLREGYEAAWRRPPEPARAPAPRR